jgi:P27 family predicted phage terminase small subunit
MAKYLDGQGPAPSGHAGPPPICPPWLDDEARQEWARILPEVMRLLTLTPVDAMTLAAYCQAYSNWKKCELQLRAEGQTFIDNRGNIKLHPLARQAVSLLTEIRRIAGEFGLSPRARMAVGGAAPTGQEEDGFNTFLRGDA